MKLTESQLKQLVLETALKVIKEGNLEEISPEFAMRAGSKANDKLKDMGRKDPRREKLKAQRDYFRKGAAERLENELGDPRIHVHSDLRTMDATEGDNQIFYRPGMDKENPKVYDNTLEKGLDEYPEIDPRERFTDYDDTVKQHFSRFDRLHGLNEEKLNAIVKEAMKKYLG